MATIEAVCVFAASSESAAGHLRQVAGELGQVIAREGWGLVYGGGGIGLMGDVARAALAGGAQVTGVIPHRLARREFTYQQASEMIVTETMR
ncbi:MAG: TIGR00730 family Rossman fold protein, partial [Gemmatimonadales bacterium]